MKTKLLNSMRALLVAAGMLAGAQAWGDTTTPVWSENYESYTSVDAISSAWTNNGSNYQATLNLCSNECGNSTKWLLTYSGNSKRQTTEYYMFPSAFTGKAYRFDAKLNMNDGNNNATESHLYFMNGAKSSDNNNPTNYLFYIGVNSSGMAYVSNGTDTETSTIGGLNSGTNSIAAAKWSKNYKSTGWFDASCIVDLEQNKVKVTLSSSSKSETFSLSLNSGSGTKQLSGLCVLGGSKLYGVVALDDLALYALTYPAFTLTSDAVEPTVGGNATVNVSDITGTIAVSSSDESVATASYADGVITINGVANGVAYITVKSTSEGVELEKTMTATVGTVATTTVTINYKDDSNNTIKASTTIDDITVGSTLTESDITYDAIIYGEGYRYVNPVPDQSLPYTVVEDGVINIVYTAQAAVTNVKEVVKAGETEISSTNVAQDGKYVGDVIYFSYPKYINYNGTLYTKDANSQTYNQSFTLTATGQECVMSYTITDIDNVVYLSEGENITGATATSAGNNMNGRSSNQQCGYTGNDLTLINLPAGSYKVTAVIYSNSSGGCTLHFQCGDTSYDEKVSGSSNWSTQTEEFAVSSASDFKWLSSGDSKNGLDLIYIQKTSETVNFTLGADAGDSYKSYVTTAATDFAATGVTAYIAKAADTTNGTVTLSTINQAPANTPVLLKGTKGGTAEIATTTDEVAAISTNYFKAADGSTAISSSDDKYVLAYNSDWEFRHYNGTLSAGKVYLDLSAMGARAESFRFVFDNEASGIDAVEKAVESKGYFNLNGQRVNAPAKGLYIVNGKKVIIK